MCERIDNCKILRVASRLERFDLTEADVCDFCNNTEGMPSEDPKKDRNKVFSSLSHGKGNHPTVQQQGEIRKGKPRAPRRRQHPFPYKN